MTHSRTILILDDNAAIRDFLVEALSEEGYCVHAVAAADDARAALRAEEPDLFLCDHWLSGTTGLALARELRAAGSTMPIVLVTADKTAQAHDLASVDFCLLKPFDLEELLDCVQTHIRQSAP